MSVNLQNFYSKLNKAEKEVWASVCGTASRSRAPSKLGRLEASALGFTGSGLTVGFDGLEELTQVCVLRAIVFVLLDMSVHTEASRSLLKKFDAAFGEFALNDVLQTAIQRVIDSGVSVAK